MTQVIDHVRKKPYQKNASKAAKSVGAMTGGVHTWLCRISMNLVLHEYVMSLTEIDNSPNCPRTT